MTDNYASETAAKLTAAIDEIRKSISTLNKDTIELGKQINQQSIYFSDQEKLAVGLFNRVNDFLDTYLKQTEAIQTSFNQIADKQNIIINEINSLLYQSRESISNAYKHIEATEQDVSKAFADSTKKIIAYHEDALGKFDKQNGHVNELLKKVDALLTHIDESIKVKLESAADTISKSLQPTLQSLIIAMKDSKEALEKTRKRMWISNLVLSGIIVIVTIIAFFV